MSLRETALIGLAAIGVLFMLVSAIGIVRLPDVYARMHAAGKATTLGVSCILLAAGFFFGEWAFVRMVLLIILFFITGPIASTTMGRAAYRTDYDRALILDYDDLAADQAQRKNHEAARDKATAESTG